MQKRVFHLKRTVQQISQFSSNVFHFKDTKGNMYFNVVTQHAGYE